MSDCFSRISSFLYFMNLWSHSRSSSFLFQVVSPCLNAIRTSYRLLVIEPEIFSKLWDWSCLLDLVEIYRNPNWSSDAELKKDIADIRWCGVQILSLTLGMSDRVISNFGVEAEEAFLCLLRFVCLFLFNKHFLTRYFAHQSCNISLKFPIFRWEEFRRDTSLELAGLYVKSPNSNKLDSSTGDFSFNQENCLQCFGLNSLPSTQFHEIEPSTRRQRLGTW